MIASGATGVSFGAFPSACFAKLAKTVFQQQSADISCDSLGILETMEWLPKSSLISCSHHHFSYESPTPVDCVVPHKTENKKYSSNDLYV